MTMNAFCTFILRFFCGASGTDIEDNDFEGTWLDGWEDTLCFFLIFAIAVGSGYIYKALFM